MLKDKGSVTNVSTFPLKIPYWTFASLSDKYFFNPLTTVIESTFLFIDVNIELNDIGIATNNIFFIIEKELFLL